MIAYLVNIFAICFWGFILLGNKPSQHNKKVFCVLASTQWIILSGLRHVSVGADTYTYKYIFNSTVQRSWNNILNDFVNILFKGAEGKDPGYPIFEKLIQYFTINYQVYLIIIALIFTVPLGVWIYKNSSEPCMSFLIYSSLFYAFFAITGIRQTIATAIVVLIGYKFIKERKFWPFLLLCLIAFPIHKSSLCFLPFYFISRKKITWKYSAAILTAFPIAIIFRNRIMNTLAVLMGYEEYTANYEGAGTWTFTTIFILIIALALWKSSTILKNRPEAAMWYNATYMALIFIPLTYINPSTMRVVQYYSMFIMLLIPEIVIAFNKKERVLVYYIGAALLIGLLIKSNPQYLLFWQ